MQCTCLHDVEKKMAEHYTEQLGTKASAQCQSIMLTIGASVDSFPRVIYTVTADKPGYRKGKDIALAGNFCPICGKPVKEQPAEPAQGEAE